MTNVVKQASGPQRPILQMLYHRKLLCNHSTYWRVLISAALWTSIGMIMEPLKAWPLMFRWKLLPFIRPYVWYGLCGDFLVKLLYKS